MAAYCPDPFTYDDPVTNSTGSPKNGTSMWNDSGIYSGNSLESLSLVINDSYGNYRYININFMCKNDKKYPGHCRISEGNHSL
jgi:hypothetical protein